MPIGKPVCRYNVYRISSICYVKTV